MPCHDFELRLQEPADEDGARVTARGWGRTVEGRLCLERTQRDEIAAWFAACFTLDEPPPRPHAEVGAYLFDALFDVRVLQLWRERPAAEHVHIVLTWEPGVPALARLAALPWELLYDAERGAFLLDAQTSIVRRMECARADPTRTGRAAPPPWRIVAAVLGSSVLDPLGAKPELDALRAAALRQGACGRAWLAQLGMSGVELQVCDNPTPTQVRTTLRERPADVLHVIAHGAWDDVRDEGALRTGPRDVAGQPLGAGAFAAQVADLGLRLVVLNVCQSARVEPGGRRHAADSLASALVRAGVPSVVAMQAPVSVESAIALTGPLYDRLLAGAPVESALHEARLALRATTSAPDWALPALYLRTPPEASPPARRRPTRIQSLLLALDFLMSAGATLLFSFCVPGCLVVESARDVRWAGALIGLGVALTAVWLALDRFASCTRQRPPRRWRVIAAAAALGLALLLVSGMASGAPLRPAESHPPARSAPAGNTLDARRRVAETLAYVAEPVSQPTALTLAVSLGASAWSADLPVSIAGVYALRSQRPSATTGLYVVHLESHWPARADDRRYKHLSLSVSVEEGARVLDGWPRSANDPKPVESALTVGADERFEIVPRTPGAIELALSTGRASPRRHASGQTWMVRDPGDAGGLHVYVLLHTLQPVASLTLQVRRRVHLQEELFGKAVARRKLDDCGRLPLSLSRP